MAGITPANPIRSEQKTKAEKVPPPTKFALNCNRINGLAGRKANPKPNCAVDDLADHAVSCRLAFHLDDGFRQMSVTPRLQYLLGPGG
jgi:hypothetical protein